MASSQVSINDVKKIPLTSYCLTEQQFKETLKAYQERAVLIMNSIREEKGKTEAYETALFINSATGTWTLFEGRGPDGYCIVAMGEQARPVTSRSMKNDESLPQKKYNI